MQAPVASPDQENMRHLIVHTVKETWDSIRLINNKPKTGKVAAKLQMAENAVHK